METEILELSFPPAEAADSVSALLQRPADARALLVLGHGAGAGMRHVFMGALADRLAAEGIATLRYQFPYMEKGSRRPDRKPLLVSTVRAAVAEGARQAHDLPLFAGGKSMAGRMTSTAAAEAGLPGVRGLVFVGFPLHPAGKPGIERAAHLRNLECPMLFLQGTRDKLAEMELLLPVLAELGKGPWLHVVDGADHGFHVLKRSGRTDEEVLDELATTTATWIDRSLAP